MMTFNKVHMERFSFKLLICDNENRFVCFMLRETINISDYHAFRTLVFMFNQEQFDFIA